MVVFVKTNEVEVVPSVWIMHVASQIRLK